MPRGYRDGGVAEDHLCVARWNAEVLVSKERELLRGSTGRPGGEHVAGVVPLVAGGRFLFCLLLPPGEERGSGQWHQRQRTYAGLGLDGSADELPADAYEGL
jgi:hypothetical protein